MKEILNEVKNMVVKQISVFIENKEGRMKKAINTLAQENINIRALSIADTTKYGILRLIVSDNEKAIEVFASVIFSSCSFDFLLQQREANDKRNEKNRSSGKIRRSERFCLIQ